MPRQVAELIRLLTEMGERTQETFLTEDRSLFSEFREAVNLGLIRAAERDGDGHWRVNVWFKKALLAGFKLGQVFESDSFTRTPFFDKHTLPTRALTGANRVRIVPGGSAIRDGAYIGEGVIMMPPSYVNIGAYVGSETMIDSHALVGSCAQVGSRVHLSAAAQIGGVLEPVGMLPVIIEDDVMVGGNAGIYEGTTVKKGAVIGSGVLLNGSTAVYDLVHGRIYRRQGDAPLVIPENAVVVPGSRPATGAFAQQHGLHIATPIIPKYRDDKTSAATAMEEALR